MKQDRAANSRDQKRVGKARRFFYENGLSIVLFSCFLAFLAGQAVTGHRQHNEDLKEHGQAGIALSDYLRSDHFLEATAENWESEFLQMFAYVLFTVFLYQQGSSESKKPAELEPVDREPKWSSKNTPWPVRKGGIILKIYENSLSLAFILLFLFHSQCTQPPVLDCTVKNNSCIAARPFQFLNIWALHASGLRPCKTGRVNSWRLERWCSYLFFCVKRLA